MASARCLIDPERPDPRVIERAAALLLEGGIVVFPTETVYGVAACLDSKAGVRRLRELKQRPPDEPFPVQVASREAVTDLVEEVSEAAATLMDAFWPGPLTIVFPRARKNAGGSGIGIRIPDHPVALAVLRKTAAPLVVPSANPRGGAPPVSADEAAAHFSEGIDLLIDGGEVQLKHASTVIRLVGGGWELLRRGLITETMLRRALRENR